MITGTQEKTYSLREVLKELRDIKTQLAKLLLVIPEESINEYKNSASIKKVLTKALKSHPVK